MDQQNHFLISDAQIKQFFTVLESEPLGSGRNAVVYLAQHLQSGVYFAVKQPKSDEHSRRAAKNEIQVLLQLYALHGQDFPVHVPRIEKYSNSLRILFEYMEKGTLFHMVSICGSFNEQQARTLMKQLFNGINQLHCHGVTHFDLKPDNIMFNSQYVMKICDYGYANNPIGYTMGYAAPEQLQQCVQHPEKCDVFSFGVVAYILVLGFPPFQNIQDSWFTLIAANDWTAFWERVKKATTKQPSSQFKALIEGTMNVHANQRYSMLQVSQLSWFNEQCDTEYQSQTELDRRFKIIQQVKMFQI